MALRCLSPSQWTVNRMYIITYTHDIGDAARTKVVPAYTAPGGGSVGALRRISCHVNGGRLMKFVKPHFKDSFRMRTNCDGRGRG